MNLSLSSLDTLTIFAMQQFHFAVLSRIVNCNFDMFVDTILDILSIQLWEFLSIQFWTFLSSHFWCLRSMRKSIPY